MKLDYDYFFAYFGSTRAYAPGRLGSRPRRPLCRFRLGLAEGRVPELQSSPTFAHEPKALHSGPPHMEFG